MKMQHNDKNDKTISMWIESIQIKLHIKCVFLKEAKCFPFEIFLKLRVQYSMCS